MPELPEVQTVVNDLKGKVVGFEVEDFDSLWKRNIGIGLTLFKKNVLGKKIVDVIRVAKFIVIVLDRGFIVLHLRMTGRLLAFEDVASLNQVESSLGKHIRHFWVLRKGTRRLGLFFHDVRKFATVDFTENLESYSSFLNLGLEPLADDFCLSEFRKLFKTTRSVRSILLDQKKIVGIGNIYVSEILFRAGVYPGKESDKLSCDEVKKIYEKTVEVLMEAIDKRGTTFSDYRDSSGQKGSFQKMLKVYNRKGRRCRRDACIGIVDKETLEQRSSFWCPVCQKR